MKVLLVSPYNTMLRAGQFLAPPLGIHRIASYLLKKRVAEVKVLDPNLEGLESLYKEASTGDYDIIGFSLLYTTYQSDLDIICHVAGCSPHSIIIAGGQGAVFTAGFLLKNTPIDIIAKGFGEFALENIIKALENGKTDISLLDDVRGLVYISNGAMTETKPLIGYTPSEFEEISKLLDFDNIPYEKYWDYMEKHYSKEHLNIMKNDSMLKTIRLMTSSHCPMKCSFCSSTNFLDSKGLIHPPLFLSPKKIIEMTEKAISAHPETTAVYYCDDDFIQDEKRTLEICSLIKSNHKMHKLNFFCLGRIDNMKPFLLKSLKNAGFKFIIYGVESFSSRILREMKKKFKSDNPGEETCKVILKTIDSGITPLMNIILFYPSSALADIIATVEKAVQMVEAGARITIYSYVEYYPGAAISYNFELDKTYKSITIKGREFQIPDNILPADNMIKSLAEESLALREELVRKITKMYNWKGVIPHPIYGLTLFLAIYKIIGMNTDKIEILIDKLMKKNMAEIKVIAVNKGRCSDVS
jgi:radical SAM superfamily enzyme YgiQ (UPF0313 family)